jgi:hypothetical protein
VLESPWTLRVLDLRPAVECARQRVPGAECVAEAELDALGLEFSPPARELVLVLPRGSDAIPEAAGRYPGRIWLLDGGFDAWKAYALTPPKPSDSDYALRAGLSRALTGSAAPPPPAVKGFVAPPRKKGGGCSD